MTYNEKIVKNKVGLLNVARISHKVSLRDRSNTVL